MLHTVTADMIFIQTICYSSIELRVYNLYTACLCVYVHFITIDKQELCQTYKTVRLFKYEQIQLYPL